MNSDDDMDKYLPKRKRPTISAPRVGVISHFFAPTDKPAATPAPAAAPVPSVTPGSVLLQALSAVEASTPAPKAEAVPKVTPIALATPAPAAPAAAPAPAFVPPASCEEDDYEGRTTTVSCDLIRKKINLFLATKEMTLTAFLEAIGHVNNNSYGRFMKLKGRDSGAQNRTFWGALRFFEDRDKAAKAAAKETKAAGKRSHATMATPTAPTAPAAPAAASDELPAALFTPSAPMVPLLPADRKSIASRCDAVTALAGTVTLSDEKVYDNCDEVRRKIAVATQSNLMSISGVCAAIGCNSNAVNRFLSKKGPDQGAGTDVYPCAYKGSVEVSAEAGQ